MSIKVLGIEIACSLMFFMILVAEAESEVRVDSIYFAPKIRQMASQNYSDCLVVKKFNPNLILQGQNSLDVVGIQGISHSIGYSVIDKVKQIKDTETSDQACQLNMFKIINRFGRAVSANAEGAQAAVRSTDFNDKSQQSCPGFGMCADIWDREDQDVYPISTLTYVVVRTDLPDEDCSKMKIVYDYLNWILFDPIANVIALSQGFGTMPKKVAQLAKQSVLDSMKCRSPDPSSTVSYRLLKDEQIPVRALTVRGSGSSLQETLQFDLLQAYSGAGISTITYNGALGSGGGQCELTVGDANCWFNASSKETVRCLQFVTDPSTQAKVCAVAGPPVGLTAFAGSDSIIEMRSATVARQGQRMFPLFAAAIGLVYNLPIPDLALPLAAANSLFLGTLVSWDDGRIRAANPGAALPNKHIIRVVRADSSGTTQAFVRALASFAVQGARPTVGGYWNSHPLKGSSAPTWPAANYTGLPPTACTLSHCTRSICAPGRYVDPASDTCLDCPIGTYADKRGQQLKCEPCERGHFSSKSGSALCSKCSESGYQDEIGQTTCKACPANTRRFLLEKTVHDSKNASFVVKVDSSAATADDCKCVPGFWLRSSLANDSAVARRGGPVGDLKDLTVAYETHRGGEACQACPDGAHCPGFEKNLQTIPRPLRGYWGDPKNPFKFYECKSVTTCYQDYHCGGGHRGRMCAEPEVGYFTVGHKWYLKCPAQPGAAAALTVFLTIIVLAVWLQIMNLAEGSIFDSFDIGVKFLHMIGFIAQFPLRWHPNLDSVVLVLLIANLEVDFIGPHCIWRSFNSATLYFFQLIVPFVIVGISTLIWVVTSRYFPGSKIDLSVAMKEPLLNKACLRDGTIRMRDWKTHATNKSIQVFGFMYQVLAYRTFTCFLCKASPDGQTSFLKAAPDVQCGSALHSGMIATGVVFTVLVLLGFPLFLCWVLYRGKQQNLLLTPHYIQMYGSFYQQWKVEVVWWEVVVLARKFSISLILALVDVPMIQGALCILLIYTSILLQLSARPYSEERNNILEIICLFCALVYVACGMIFYPSLDQNQDCVGTSDALLTLGQKCYKNLQIKQACSFALIFLVIVTFLLAVGMTLWEVYERYLSRGASKYILESRKWFGVKNKSEKISQRKSITIFDSIPVNLRRFSAEFASRRSSAEASQHSPADSLSPSAKAVRLTGAYSGRVDPGTLDSRSASNFNQVAPIGNSLSGSSQHSVDDSCLGAGDEGKVESELAKVQLRLSHMLDGYYLSSWKDMLMEMEVRDDDIQKRYKEDNEASILIDQELLYMQMDARLPRFSCNLHASLSSMSNSSLSDVARQLILHFPSLIDYMIMAQTDSRTGLLNFLKSYISFRGKRSQFVKERESVIVPEYAPYVADFLLKQTESQVQVFRSLLEDLARAKGLDSAAGQATARGRRRDSVHEAVAHILTQHSKASLFDGFNENNLKAKPIRWLHGPPTAGTEGEKASPRARDSEPTQVETRLVLPEERCSHVVDVRPGVGDDSGEGASESGVADDGAEEPSIWQHDVGY